jgi:hypothetical protein
MNRPRSQKPRHPRRRRGLGGIVPDDPEVVGTRYGGMGSVDPIPPKRSAAETADVVGVSEATVKRARLIYDDPEAMQVVREGVGILTASTNEGRPLQGEWL